MLDDLDKPGALLIGFHHSKGFNGAAQRGERILELVAHISGKGLDGINAVIEGAGHVAERTREMADLVAPRGEIRNLDALVDAAAYPLGGGRESANGFGD